MADFVAPDELDMRRKMAQRLMAGSASTEPVGHWTQALARALQGGVGAMWQGSAQEGEKQNRQATMDALGQNPQMAQLSQGERQLMANNPALMNSAMGQIYANKFDPMAGLKKQQIQHSMDMDRARLAETQRMNSLQANQMKFQTPEGRAQVAQQYGLQPGSPEFKSFVLGGSLKSTDSAYGKQGTIIQGGDGKYYSVQFAENGTRKIEPLEINGTAMTPARGVDTVGDVIIDKATGREVRNVGGNIAAGKAAQEIGEARGKATVDLGRVVDNATQMLDTIQKARTHPGRKYGTGTVLGRLPAIGGDQAGFVALTDQIQGKAFLEAFNSLKGGGQITEAEGRKATDAIARLNRVQNDRDYDAAFDDLQSVVNAGLARARRGAGPMPSPTGSAPVRVTSPEEAARLPSGTRFLTPDGREKIVP